MNVTAPADLIDELEVVLKERSAEGRARTLQRLSELLLSCAERLNPSQVGLFDDVLIRLLDCVGARALAELSETLADSAASPKQTVRKLARHQDSAVAAPLLSRSPILVDADLIEIVKNRSQQHLAAVAGRQNLNDALTDVILKLAGREASRALARNPSARFSSRGFAVLLAAAGRDETIAESLGLRPDLPAATLQGLLSRVTGTVRARLLKSASAELKEKIRIELDGIDARVEPLLPQDPQVHSAAHAAVAALSRTGKLNDSTVNRFAIRNEHANVVAALSLLSGGTVETIAPLMDEPNSETLLIACRASRLNWQTTLSILNNRRIPPPSKAEIEQAKQLFEMLFVSTAQYTIRFEPPVRPTADAGSNHRAAAAAGGRA
jgi:uncharacterized protein (DUF2336 family)